MKNLKQHKAVKVVALLLALVIGAAAFWSSYATLYYWDDLWSAEGYFSSTPCYSSLSSRYNSVMDLVQMELDAKWSGKSDYLDHQRLELLRASLSAEKTNFRFVVRDAESGAMLYGNLAGNDISDEVIFQHLFPTVITESGSFGSSAATESATESDPFVPRASSLVIEYGLPAQLTVNDEFLLGQGDYVQTRYWLPAAATGALICDGLFLLLMLFLCSAAGHHKGKPGITPTRIDRLPTDVFTLLAGFLFMVLCAGGAGITYASSREISLRTVVGMILFSTVTCGTVVGYILSLCVRVKLRTFWRSCLIWRICAAIGRALKLVFFQWSITGRMVLIFLVYLFGTFQTAISPLLWIPYQFIALYLSCRWTAQWRSICKGTASILDGNAESKIATDKMYADLRGHAEQLNDLGSAVSITVDKQLASERFKAELITNVSHDLKTPLTSIINYVDLLKKEDITNEKALEYIEVLDRKSQRLKKLTEDLVDASKASTGSTTVVLEHIGLAQLIRQAAGEYEEKLAGRDLSLVTTLPEAEVYINADGRHLWRILDNLLGNCAKYALEGTRIYLDVRGWTGDAVISVKNVSRDALNITPDLLMERFVRGEESRSTEGSGLGLSIARSLTELQGGSFRLEIDGDLFKAVIRFPVAVDSPPSA